MKKLYLFIIVTLFLISCKGEDSASAIEKYDSDLRVYFIDVGHGDCIFILTPNDTIEGNGECEGYRILIDAGKKGRGSKYVIPYLKNLGMEDGYTIDYIIATHAHEDHIGGMPEIYDTYQVNNTLDPGYHHTTNAYNDFYNKALNEPNSNFYYNLVESGLITENGDELDLGSELQARILYTNPDDSSGINNTSIVLWIKYCDVSFLFMADAEGKERADPPSVIKYVENYLVENYAVNELKSNVLQVGHHGSETASTDDFIQAVQPVYAVILAGRGKFGSVTLPDQTVIERYMNAGAEVLRTDEDDEGKTESEAGGDDNIVLRTDGHTAEIIRQP